MTSKKTRPQKKLGPYKVRKKSAGRVQKATRTGKYVPKGIAKRKPSTRKK